MANVNMSIYYMKCTISHLGNMATLSHLAMRSTHLLLAVTAVRGPVRQHLEAQQGHEGEDSLPIAYLPS